MLRRPCLQQAPQVLAAEGGMLEIPRTLPTVVGHQAAGKRQQTHEGASRPRHAAHAVQSWP